MPSAHSSISVQDKSHLITLFINLQSRYTIWNFGVQIQELAQDKMNTCKGQCESLWGGGGGVEIYPHQSFARGIAMLAEYTIYYVCDVTLSVYPHRASLKNYEIEPTTFPQKKNHTIYCHCSHMLVSMIEERSVEKNKIPQTHDKTIRLFA